MTVRRYDVGRFSGVRPTPQGGRRIPAALTRVGVFPYMRADGTIRRELRPPEEVFKAESLASLAAAPVTDLHPPEMVNAGNWDKYSVGHVGDSVRRDGKLVKAEMTISKESMVQKLDAREVKENSCGYNCDLEMTPGTWHGEKYDCIQRNIVYNHVAIGPENWGRAGSEVSLRFDGKEIPVDLDPDDAVCRFDSEAEDSTQPNNTTGENPTMSKVRIDSIEYDFGSAGHVQALEKQRDDAVARADAAEATATEATSESEKTKGELTSEKARADKAEEQLKKFDDPKHLDSLVEQRSSLLEKARKLDSEADYTGLNESEVMRKALEQTDCEVPEGASNDFVSGVFTSEVKRADKKLSGTSFTGSLRQAGPRKDEKPNRRVDARDEFMKRSQSAHTKPLAFSKRKES